jgi:CheY-like chemotaxis protein
MADRLHSPVTGSDCLRTARLLLVEDDRDSLEVLTVLLSEKYNVSSYASAAEALEVLEAARPDLVVLDIRMAPVDGLQCLEAIRAKSGHASTPAIALTGYAHDAERRAFLDAGFQAVVTKPILDYEELEVLIDTLLKSCPASCERRIPTRQPGSVAVTNRFPATAS